jgi:hypothetical protein
MMGGLRLHWSNGIAFGCPALNTIEERYIPGYASHIREWQAPMFFDEGSQ